MRLELNDQGLLVDYINYVLNIVDDRVNTQTLTRLQQYKAHYRVSYKDTSGVDDYYVNPITGVVIPNSITTDQLEKCYEFDKDYNNYNVQLQVYPNKLLDIYAMTPLCDIDIEVYNTKKIKQIQELLSNTEYTNYTQLPISGEYTQTTLDAIKKFQIAHKLYQPKYPIVNNKNMISTLPSIWEQGSINSIGTLIDNSSSITSDYIEIDPNFSYFLSTLDEIKFKVYFYDTNHNYLSEDYFEAHITNYPDFGSFFTASGVSDIKIPQCLASSSNQFKYIRIGVISSDSIIPELVESLHIMLEKNSIKTEYEPYEYNSYNTYYSGYLNTVTYNKIKKEFKVQEVL